jgi:predicted DNA-binding protein
MTQTRRRGVMVLTVRLDDETRRKLSRLARATGKTRSDIVREAIRQYLPAEADSRTVHDRFADIIGTAHLGGGDRARRSEEILREMFARKRTSM